MTRPSRTGGGKASDAKARNASAAKGRKTTKTKRRIAPAATRANRNACLSERVTGQGHHQQLVAQARQRRDRFEAEPTIAARQAVVHLPAVPA